MYRKSENKKKKDLCYKSFLIENYPNSPLFTKVSYTVRNKQDNNIKYWIHAEKDGGI